MGRLIRTCPASEGFEGLCGALATTQYALYLKPSQRDDRGIAMAFRIQLSLVRLLMDAISKGADGAEIAEER